MKGFSAVILNLFQDPAVNKIKSSAWILKQVQYDHTIKGFTFCRHPELVSGSSKMGFTLIELLVVVLIIGILAAVALPQYQKAVLKSRVAELQLVARQLKNAQDVYYLANGEYADSFDKLDISLNGTEYPSSDGNLLVGLKTPRGLDYKLYGGFSYGGIQKVIGFTYYYDTHAGLSGETARCYAVTEAADGVCRSMGTLLYQETGCNVGEGKKCNVYALW